MKHDAPIGPCSVVSRDRHMIEWQAQEEGRNGMTSLMDVGGLIAAIVPVTSALAGQRKIFGCRDHPAPVYEPSRHMLLPQVIAPQRAATSFAIFATCPRLHPVMLWTFAHGIPAFSSEAIFSLRSTFTGRPL